MRNKITIIGAGSVIFAKKLIGDILQFSELADSEICLMDIDPQRLKIAEAMARKIVATLAVPAIVTATTNRTDSIRNASYVICTIQVGGYEPSTVVDFEIPAKYGLKQTIADTLGIGGIFRSLRTIPKIIEIAQDIEKVGHTNCLLLNYSNPMATNCWAVDRAVGIPHIGLCHSVQGTSKNLANYTRLNYEDVTYKVAGINHMAFFLEFQYRGQDAYPLLFKALENPATFAQDKVRFEMMRRLGYFVTESSEHQSEYVPYFIHHGEEMIQKFGIPIDEYRRRCEIVIATWQQQERDLLGEGKNAVFEVEPQSHEYGSYIIYAQETNTPTVVYGNVPNRGLITNLPDGCCVEVPCLIDSNGVQPTHIGKLPPQLAAICRSNVSTQELTVEAALTGKRESIYHAAMMDPHTAATLPLDKIWAMCDEMIEAHQKDGFLGEFEPTIPNTGRGFKGVGDRIIATLEAQDAFVFEGGSQNTIKATIENNGDTDLQGDFSISATCGSIAPVNFQANVAAGETTSVPISVELKTTIEGPLDLNLSTESSNILCKGVLIQPRKILQNGGAFSIELAGIEAIRGQVSYDESGLIFDLAIEDSNIVPTAPSNLGVTSGSGIDVLIAVNDESETKAFTIVPADTKNKIPAQAFNDVNQPVSGISISQSDTGINYSLNIRIPYDLINLDPKQSEILLDVRGSINALGDAHSGGCVSLSGIFLRHEVRSRFVKLMLA